MQYKRRLRNDPQQDQYICPEGNPMQTNGKWHDHTDGRRNGKSAYRFKRYTTGACRNCISRQKCTKGRNGRYIVRSEYTEALESNTKRVFSDPDYHRQRQQITEHPFGTLKRQRGFTHTNVRGKEKVMGEIGLIFIGYDLKRCISILGTTEFIKALRECCSYIYFRICRLILSQYKRFLYCRFRFYILKYENFKALRMQPNENNVIFI